MPEILYRDDVNRFSVYRLRDIPDGMPRSGWASLGRWQNGTALPRGHETHRGWLAAYHDKEPFGWASETRDNLLCAVADEHAGPLLAASASQPDPSESIALHEERTRHLGAQHGEHVVDYQRRGAYAVTSESAAWSAHLRFLVRRSEAERRAREPSVGED